MQAGYDEILSQYVDHIQKEQVAKAFPNEASLSPEQEAFLDIQDNPSAFWKELEKGGAK